MKKLISFCLLLLTVFSMSSVGMMDVQAAASYPLNKIEEPASPFAMPPMPDLTAGSGFSVKLNVHQLGLEVGKTYQLKPTVTVPSGYSKNVKYFVQYSDIISVDANGLVTGLKPGDSGVACQLAQFTEGMPAEGTYDICWVTVVESMFKDVRNANDYFFKPVYWAVRRGITTGFTDSHGKPTGYFKPNATCTRGQIVTFLYRCFRVYDVFRPDTSGVQDFSDVKSDAYYYDAVRWAVALGITTGYTDKNGNPTGYFGPDDVCTRAQVVTFIYRLIHEYWDVDTSEVEDFTDVKSNAYYYNAVKWCVAFGITNGYSNSDGSPSGKFGPDDKCTRGQVVTFLYRAEDAENLI